MDRLTPTRTLTATRLITVTTTYETELTENEFLALTPLETLTKRLLGSSEPVNLDSLAVQIVETSGDDFRTLGGWERDLIAEFGAILAIANAFDYEKFGKLMLSEYTEGEGYTLLDGNHRSVALALLLKSEQIEYQPVTAMFTEIQQSISEPIGSDTIAQTIEQAQQGIRHYPVRRKR